MASIPTYDPGSTEAKSPLLAGITEGLHKITSAVDMETGTIVDAQLNNVPITDDDKNRIYQANMGQRLWLQTPAPTFKKNGEPITAAVDGFEVDYVGGSISFDTLHRLQDDDVVTVSCSYIVGSSKTISDIQAAIEEAKKLADRYKGTFETADDLTSFEPVEGDFAFVLSGPSVYFWDEKWIDVTSEIKVDIKKAHDDIDQIKSKIDSLTASEVDYNNDQSRLPASNVQEAIDRLSRYSGNVNTDGGAIIILEDGMTAEENVIEINSDNLQADVIGYNNTASFLKAVTMQQAIDEIVNNSPYALYSYDGVNLAEKFAWEIGNTDFYTWIRQRLAARDIKGFHVKDYFEITTTNGYLIQPQIADINHDLGFMDTEITKFHIDFISKDLWPEAHVWNKKNYNNGLSTEPDPWLCCDLKAWLNSEDADVPNDTTVNPDLAHVTYYTDKTGVFDKLPQSLQEIIVERRNYEPQRYSKDDLLTDDNNWGPYKNIGKLWVPNETEVYGQIVWGTQNGYSVGNSHQFPIFADGRTRIKHLGVAGNRYYWWLRSANSGTSMHAAIVSFNGIAYYYTTSYTSVGAPVCFRISG